jgi:hypothetical protein
VHALCHWQQDHEAKQLCRVSVLVYVLNFLLIGALVWWMHRQEWADTLKPYFFPALIFKMVCGVLLGLLYYMYYGEGDTIVYHKVSTAAADIFREQGLGQYMRYLFLDEVQNERLSAYREEHYMGAWNVIKLFSLPNLLAGRHYYLVVLYLALFSFSGMWYLTQQLIKRYPHAVASAVLAFLFLPSVVFWSSGLLKESLLMGGVGYFMGATVALSFAPKKNLLPLVLLLISSLLLIWFVKYFIAAALGALVIVGVLIAKTFSSAYLSRFGLPAKVGLIVGILVLVFWLTSTLNYNLQFNILPEVVVDNYQTYLAMSLDKPHVEFSELQPSYLSLLLYAPLAFLWILFRPFPWESTSTIHLIAATENLFLLLLTLWSLYSLYRQKYARFDWFITSMWIFSLLLGVLLTYSMPNLGTLNRYRVVFLPFYVYLLCLNPRIASALNKISPKLIRR